ncbi:hypothetical protein [Sphingobium yanoikuyae]|uniref:Uncharacterized protein n=1 Tax=Sphingobium yanoikuyae TaxID=13690 RepID=A0A0J9CYR5_SPHYA|nr:hypothetical protein [Sphingobium yanoikuyae]ATP18558.1 hypothetical protein BV87_09250 [Sphingobium yanoikuyae]KMW30192.1 hypothetical protein BV87_07450 [Sphingobium yanoikuyae]
MRPGKKLTDPQRKKLAGTFKQCVDGATTAISAVLRDIPVQPDWMSEAGKEVWAADLEKVMATGLTGVDAGAFALYCETMAVFIQSVRAGQPVNAAYRSELRKQMELLSIAGAKSRLAKIGQEQTAKASPFSVRPK